ncbi:TPA: hypothetical protein VIU84_000084 [Streptococcus pyogenes]|nr:hypothetical protein [Streptococcus pyogenes]
MKTKSKHFLKLATLCLALLGTTLLMGRPVKAEVMKVPQEQRQANTGDSTRENSEQDPYQEGYDRGYDSGYEDGRKGNQRPENPTPDSIPYGGDDETSYKNGYSDGYGLGYEEGRHEGYPVEAFLEDIWGFFTSIFKSWFSSGTNSQ